MTAAQQKALATLFQHMLNVDCLSVGITTDRNGVIIAPFRHTSINFTIYCEIDRDGLIPRLETWDQTNVDPTIHVADTYDDVPIKVGRCIDIILEELTIALQESIRRLSA